MRDKVIAVLDLGWLIAAIVASFTFRPATVIASLTLFGAAIALGWCDRKAPRDRSSWRYWTEPRLDQPERWSTTYWTVLLTGFGLLLLVRLLWGLAVDEPSGVGLFGGLLALSYQGWRKAEQAEPDTPPLDIQGHQ